MLGENEKKNRSIASGLFWSFLERIGAQGVSFIVSIVLARILIPEDYGVVAIVQIFITFANAITTTGLNAAIIQKKDVSKEDDSSAFVLNMILGIGLYRVIFLFAPVIAQLYHLDLICPVLRVLGIRIPISAFNAMQRAYVSRKMEFKKFFYSTFGGTVVSAFVGIYLALKGFGCWALVFQYLTNTAIDTIILLITVEWRPSFNVSLKSMKNMLDFGWKVLAGSLISEIYLELRNIVIGWKYSSTDLAYYKRGQQFPALFLTNITSALGSVMFPALSKEQDEFDSLKNKTRKSVRCCIFIMAPLMFGMAAVAKAMVLLILTDKWEGCIPYLIMYCISYAVLPISTLSEQAYKALGLGNVLLWTQCISKGLGIVFILITIPFGVYWIGVGMVISTYMTLVLYLVVNARYIRYSIKEQIKDLGPTLIIAIIMAVVVYMISFLVDDCILLLIIQLLFGILIYIGLSWYYKIEALEDYLILFRKIGNKK